MNDAHRQGGCVKRYMAHPEGAILDNLLGELDARDGRALSDHLSHCASCRALEQEWREVLHIAADAGEAPRRGAPPRRRVWHGLLRRARRPRTLGRLSAPHHAEHKEGAAGWVIRRGDGPCEVVVRGLDVLPVGEVYVVWLDGGHGPRNVAAFAVDQAGDGSVPLSVVLHGTTLSITAEEHANEVMPRGTVRLSGPLP